jgi:hypothetical protein
MEIINIQRSIEAKNILSINPNTWNKITVDTKLITENMIMAVHIGLYL